MKSTQFPTDFTFSRRFCSFSSNSFSLWMPSNFCCKSGLTGCFSLQRTQYNTVTTIDGCWWEQSAQGKQASKQAKFNKVCKWLKRTTPVGHMFENISVVGTVTFCHFKQVGKLNGRVEGRGCRGVEYPVYSDTLCLSSFLPHVCYLYNNYTH